MQSSVESINSVQRRLTLVIAPEAVNAALDTVYMGIQKKAKVSGFRPGKVPLYVVKKLYGLDYILQDAMEHILRTSLFPAAEREGIKPIAPPFVEAFSPLNWNQPCELTVVFDVMPKVELGNALENLKVQALKQKVTPQFEMQKFAEFLRGKGHQREMPADVLLEKNHRMMISGAMKDTEGKSFGDVMTEQSFDLTDPNSPLPQVLIDGMMGMKAGELRIIPYVMEVNKDAVLEVTLHKIWAVELPVVDEEFAKDLQCDSVQQMMEQFRAALVKAVNTFNMTSQEDAVMEEMLRRVPVEAPPALVEAEMDAFFKREHSFHTLSAYDKQLRLKAEEEVRRLLIPAAEERLRRGLLLFEIFTKEKLQITDEQVQEKITQMHGNDPISKEQKSYMKLLAIQDVALAYLISQATIEYIDA